MEVNYGTSAPFQPRDRGGVSAAQQSYELVSRFDEVRGGCRRQRSIKANCSSRLSRWRRTVHGTVAEAVEESRSLRARLRDAAADGGSLIASAGTHPFSRYEHQDVTESERYHELVEAMKWVAERELIFGSTSTSACGPLRRRSPSRTPYVRGCRASRPVCELAFLARPRHRPRLDGSRSSTRSRAAACRHRSRPSRNTSS